MWAWALRLRHLDVSLCPLLAGPFTLLPPGLLHLNASFTALGGGVPPLPADLLTLDLLAAGLEQGIAGAKEGPGGGWASVGRLSYVDVGSNALTGPMPGGGRGMEGAGGGDLGGGWGRGREQA